MLPPRLTHNGGTGTGPLLFEKERISGPLLLSFTARRKVYWSKVSRPFPGVRNVSLPGPVLLLRVDLVSIVLHHFWLHLLEGLFSFFSQRLLWLLLMKTRKDTLFKG